MKNATKLSWVVLGIGVALVIFGAFTFAQQALLANQTVGLTSAVQSLGAASANTSANAEPVAQRIESLSADVKVASADTSIAIRPVAEAAVQAPQAATAAPVIPTVDNVAAIKQYQLTYPIPDHLWIDKIKVDAKIQPVGPGKTVTGGAVEWSSPNNKNVGWHDYSGHIGEGKNIVLNGHNNIFGSVFRKLYTLKAGDEIRLGAGDKVVTYVVEQSMILAERDQPLAVRVKNAQYIQPMADDRLTLISCWPETNNTHRVIVIARPVKST